MENRELIYQYMFQDEYNNLYLIGIYNQNEIEKALEDINKEIESYSRVYSNLLTLEDIKPHAGTFGPDIGVELDLLVDENDDKYTTLSGCMIRGFVFDKEELKKCFTIK